MEVDNLCKFLADRHPASVASWLLGVPLAELGPAEILKTELSSEPIRADCAIFIKRSGRILHVEFQVDANTSGKTPLPLRMLDYWVRLHRQYRVGIDQVLLLIKRTSKPTSDHFEFEGTSHRYRVVRLWEVEPGLLLDDPVLFPFAVLAKARDRDRLVSEVMAKANTIEGVALRDELVTLTQMFAGMVFTLKEIRAMSKNDILRQSVVYQYILEEGRNEGLHTGAVGTLIGVLEARLGPAPAETRLRLEQASNEVLQRLVLAAAVAPDWDAFVEALDGVSEPA